MKSGASFFRIDMMSVIFLDMKYFLLVCLCIYYEKLAVKLHNDGTVFCKEVKLLSVRHNL